MLQTHSTGMTKSRSFLHAGEADRDDGRAEVAVLSRNVRILGDVAAQSRPYVTVLEGGRVQMAGVECASCGQANPFLPFPNIY